MENQFLEQGLLMDAMPLSTQQFGQMGDLHQAPSGTAAAEGFRTFILPP